MPESEKVNNPAVQDPKIKALMKKLKQRKEKDAASWTLWALGALSSVAAGDKALAARLGARTPASQKKAESEELEDEMTLLGEKREGIEDKQYAEKIEQYRHLQSRVDNAEQRRIKEIEMAMKVSYQQSTLDHSAAVENVRIHNAGVEMNYKHAAALVKEQTEKIEKNKADGSTVTQATMDMAALFNPTDPLNEETMAAMIAMKGMDAKGIGNMVADADDDITVGLNLWHFGPLMDEAFMEKIKASGGKTDIKGYVPFGEALAKGLPFLDEGASYGTAVDQLVKGFEDQVAIAQTGAGGRAAPLLVRVRRGLSAANLHMEERARLMNGTGIYSAAGSLQKVGAPPRIVQGAFETDARLKELRGAADAKGVTVEDQIKKMNKVLGHPEDAGLASTHYKTKLDKLDEAYTMLEERQDMLSVRGIRGQIQSQPVFKDFMAKNNFPVGAEDTAFSSFLKIQRRENMKKKAAATQSMREIDKRGSLFPTLRSNVVAPDKTNESIQVTAGNEAHNALTLSQRYGEAQKNKKLNVLGEGAPVPGATLGPKSTSATVTLGK